MINCRVWFLFRVLWSNRLLEDFFRWRGVYVLWGVVGRVLFILVLKFFSG